MQEVKHGVGVVRSTDQGGPLTPSLQHREGHARLLTRAQAHCAGAGSDARRPPCARRCGRRRSEGSGGQARSLRGAAPGAPPHRPGGRAGGGLRSGLASEAPASPCDCARRAAAAAVHELFAPAISPALRRLWRIRARPRRAARWRRRPPRRAQSSQLRGAPRPHHGGRRAGGGSHPRRHSPGRQTGRRWQQGRRWRQGLHRRWVGRRWQQGPHRRCCCPCHCLCPHRCRCRG